jgi:hypothetical protein
MAEVVMDFFDRLKSCSRGYASLDYEFREYRAADVVKLDILINGEKVDALSLIVHRANSQYRGRELASKMRELIPRQMYDVAIQAAIGATSSPARTSRRCARTCSPSATAATSRARRKLLEKQKAGKKRMKQVGRWKSRRRPSSPCCGSSIDRGTTPVNFALILFLLLLVTGVAWVVDKLWLAAVAPPRRRQATAAGGSSTRPGCSR